jgi:hypothetical protein
MIADGFTKALPRQRFRNFCGMISLMDIRARLEAGKQMEAVGLNLYQLQVSYGRHAGLKSDVTSVYLLMI